MSKADKRRNRELAIQRIVCEHVIGKLQVVKILAERYRTRRRFGVRIPLLAALYNLDLLYPR